MAAKRATGLEEPPPFAGFPLEGAAFLSGLAAHNERARFEAHRATYEAALRGPMESLMAALAEAMARRRIPLGGDPRKAVFRIHRDVRFSKDKSPYKTHVGAVLTRDRAAGPGSGVLYVHVAPEESFCAAGVYQPEPKALEAMRGAIADRPAVFKRMLGALAKSGLALAEDESALKRLPRGHEGLEDPVLAEALRRRSFILRRTLAPEALGRPDLAGEVAAFAEAALPLLRFGWAAMDQNSLA